jgi:6-phosphogluconolactonase
VTPSRPELHVAASPEDSARAAAAEVFAMLRDAVTARGRATVALSGGTTPGLLYHHLAAAGPGAAPWNRIDFFFGDERCVPPTSPHSNYALAQRELFEPLGIPAASVHRMQGELRPANAAAASYERDMRACFAAFEPALDLVLLGIGADGHTASLFPGSEALGESQRWVVPVRAPAGYEPTERITLTLPVLNRARAVFFLAAGVGKREAVAGALGENPSGQALPAARVRPAGRLAWFLDEAAAGGVR